MRKVSERADGMALVRDMARTVKLENAFLERKTAKRGIEYERSYERKGRGYGKPVPYT